SSLTPWVGDLTPLQLSGLLGTVVRLGAAPGLLLMPVPVPVPQQAMAMTTAVAEARPEPKAQQQQQQQPGLQRAGSPKPLLTRPSLPPQLTTLSPPLRSPGPGQQSTYQQQLQQQPPLSSKGHLPGAPQEPPGLQQQGPQQLLPPPARRHDSTQQLQQHPALQRQQTLPQQPERRWEQEQRGGHEGQEQRWEQHQQQQQPSAFLIAYLQAVQHLLDNHQHSRTTADATAADLNPGSLLDILSGLCTAQVTPYLSYEHEKLYGMILYQLNGALSYTLSQRNGFAPSHMVEMLPVLAEIVRQAGSRANVPAKLVSVNMKLTEQLLRGRPAERLAAVAVAVQRMRWVAPPGGWVDRLYDALAWRLHVISGSEPTADSSHDPRVTPTAAAAPATEAGVAVAAAAADGALHNTQPAADAPGSGQASNDHTNSTITTASTAATAVLPHDPDALLPPPSSPASSHPPAPPSSGHRPIVAQLSYKPPPQPERLSPSAMLGLLGAAGHLARVASPARRAAGAAAASTPATAATAAGASPAAAAAGEGGVSVDPCGVIPGPLATRLAVLLGEQLAEDVLGADEVRELGRLVLAGTGAGGSSSEEGRCSSGSSGGGSWSSSNDSGSGVRGGGAHRSEDGSSSSDSSGSSSSNSNSSDSSSSGGSSNNRSSALMLLDLLDGSISPGSVDCMEGDMGGLGAAACNQHKRVHAADNPDDVTAAASNAASTHAAHATTHQPPGHGETHPSTTPAASQARKRSQAESRIQNIILGALEHAVTTQLRDGRLRRRNAVHLSRMLTRVLGRPPSAAWWDAAAAALSERSEAALACVLHHKSTASAASAAPATAAKALPQSPVTSADEPTSPALRDREQRPAYPDKLALAALQAANDLLDLLEERTTVNGGSDGYNLVSSSCPCRTDEWWLQVSAAAGVCITRYNSIQRPSRDVVAPPSSPHGGRWQWWRRPEVLQRNAPAAVSIARDDARSLFPSSEAVEQLVRYAQHLSRFINQQRALSASQATSSPPRPHREGPLPVTAATVMASEAVIWTRALT
ncbi:hypothetical protein Agub_g6711, partial [Astrephomene gubernaculifera]